MTAKRDTSRQRRANQNRAAREALAARRQAAAPKAEPEPIAKRARGRSRGQATPVVSTRAKSAVAGSVDAGPANSSRRSRFTPAPVVDDQPPASGIRARAAQLPGGSQMLAGLVLVAAGSLALCFLKVVRVADGKHKFHDETFIQRFGPWAFIYLAMPILLAAIPVLSMNHRRRRTAWNIGAFSVGLWILLSGLGLFYLFGAGAMVWGVMKASRAEGPAGPGLSRLRQRFRGAGRGAADDASSVIDADAAEARADPGSD